MPWPRSGPRIADVTNTAIDLSHHSRKTGGAEVTVEDGRGAIALLNAVRSARVLNTMTEDDATKAGIEGHRSYFKLANGKIESGPAVRNGRVVSPSIHRSRQRDPGRPISMAATRSASSRHGNGRTRSTA